MICGGDEIGRTQKGNNNAYAQDNEISWYDWTPDPAKQDMFQFTANLIKLRREHSNLHRRKFFQDRRIGPGETVRTVCGADEQDIMWIRPDGNEMTADEWKAGWVRCIGLMLNGRTLDDVDGLGQPLQDDTFLMLLNPHHEKIDFYMPKGHEGTHWELCFDTKEGSSPQEIEKGQPYELRDRSFACFREKPDGKKAVV
jgi:glycogen operon protein